MTALPELIENDPAALTAYVASLKPGLVVFDGRARSGKTHFARQTAPEIGAAFIDVDAFLNRQRGEFLNALRLDELRVAVTVALTGSRRVLLAGVCARQVVELAKLPPVVAFIWVEPISPTLLPNARRLFADDLNRDDETLGGERRHELADEVEAYIEKCDPRFRADRVYLNAYDGT